MRKKVFGRKLGRAVDTRRALFRGLIKSLITYGEITTTDAKAKSIMPDIDGLVNLAKDGSTASLRRLYGQLGNDKKVVKLMVEGVAVSSKNRNSGYVKMVKMGARRGDNAEMTKLTWTDKVEVEKTKEVKPKVVKESSKEVKPVKTKKK